MSLRVKQGLVVAGLILFVIGLVTHVNLLQGVGFGAIVVGFVAAGGV